MPVNKTDRLLFVHIPKTGGTSVEECLGMRGSWQHENLDTCFGLIQSVSLLRRGFGSNFLQHLTFLELCELLGDDLLGLTPFAVLRDPWTRLLSSFRRKDPDLCSLFQYKCHRDLRDLSFAEYVELASWLDHPHLRPQWKFLCASGGHTPDPRIKLFRLEQMSSLELWLSQYLRRRLQISRCNVHVPSIPLPVLHSDELQVLQKTVRDLYAKDYELLSRCLRLETQ